ncbi:MAG: DUF465 domain-containing protein [Nitrospirae bacterium]|nr:DUF465 domain-containing protein [Nitrospirota bacterium]
MNEAEIVETLKKENEEFKNLYQQHRDMDGHLAELDKKVYLTPEEDMERKRLQKEKLNKKDRLAEFIREYKKQHSLN